MRQDDNADERDAVVCGEAAAHDIDKFLVLGATSLHEGRVSKPFRMPCPSWWHAPLARMWHLHEGNAALARDHVPIGVAWAHEQESEQQPRHHPGWSRRLGGGRRGMAR